MSENYPIKILDKNIVLNIAEMQLNTSYPITLGNKKYLYIKTSDHEIEVYEEIQ